MKTSVFYFQTFDALLSNTDVWPVEVLETQRYIGNVFNFRFSGLACEFPSLFTPLGELASLLILPLICILLSGSTSPLVTSSLKFLNIPI